LKKSFLNTLLFFSIFCALKSYSQAPGWLWSRGAHASTELVNDVAVDRTTNDVYVVGSFNANLSAVYPGTTLTALYGGSDAFLIKYNSSGTVQWYHRMGSGGSDNAVSVSVDNSGNVYVAGKTNTTTGNSANFYHDPAQASPNTYDVTCAGADDIFIAKYNSSGVIQWAITAGGTGADVAQGIKADANGVYITGSYVGTVNFKSTDPTVINRTTVSGSSEVFVAKYSVNGVVQWVAKAGSSSADAGYDITADANNVYVVGDYLNTFTPYNSANVAQAALAAQAGGTADAFILCYTQAGAYNWGTNISAAAVDNARGITDDANYIYVTGGVSTNASFKYPSPTFLTTSNTLQDTYITKIAKSSGVFQYAKVIPGNNTEYGQSIVQLNGKLFLTGRYNGASMNFATFGGPTLATAGGYDVFLSSFFTSGIFIYAKSGGGTGADIGYGVDVDSNEDAYVGGDGGSATLMFSPTPNLVLVANSNIFLAKAGCGVALPSPLAGSDQAVCTSATMAGNNPSPGSGLWTLQSGSGSITTPSSFNSGITGLGSGNNTFIWTVSSGTCTSLKDTVVINGTTPPTVSSAGSNQTVCATIATMAGNTPATGSGLWTLVSGAGTITSPTSPNSGITALGFGINVFQWTISNSPCTASSSTMSIQRDTPPSTSAAGSNQTVCATVATLGGNVPAVGTGTWSVFSGAATITSPNAANSGLTALGVGVNVLQWTIGSGTCTASSSTVIVQRDQVPSTSLAGSNQTVCASVATMAGNTPAVGTGTWSLVSGAGTITSPTAPNSGITGLGFGVNVFMWTVGNGVCANSTSTMSIQRDTPPSASVAGPNQTVCATSAVFAATTPAVGTGTWSLVSGSGVPTTPTSPNSAVTGLGFGVNVFMWTVGNGVCTNNTSTMSIQRDTPPTASAAGSNQTVCATVATMAGNTPAVGTGTWSLVSGAGTITSPTAPNSGITALGFGVNVFMWTVGNGVCANSTSTMSIQRDTPPSASVAGPNQTVCTTSTVFAPTAPAVGTGTWSLVSGSGVPTTPTSPNSAVTGLGFGVNVFMWTVGNGVCTNNTSTMSIQRDTPPTTSAAGPNQTVCATVATMAGNTPAVGTATWSLISGAGTITSPNTSNSGITAIGLGISVFQWEISNGVCPSSTSTMSIQHDDVPTTSIAGPSQSICVITTANMAGNVPAIGTGSWTLISGSALITTPTAANTGITAIGLGVNVFRWTISNGVCPSSTSTMSITRYANPTASSAGPNQTVCATTANMAANTPAIGTGSWTLISGSGTIVNPILETTNITSLGIGVNIFQWTISNGVCAASSSTMSIQRDDNPTISLAGPNQTICVPNSATMAGNVPSVGTGSWTLVSGSALITTPTSPNSGITTLGLGVNVFRWTISNGVCPSSSSTMSIQRDAPPTIASAGPNQTVCVGTGTMAANTPAIGTGSWTLISGFGLITTPTSPNTGLTALALGSNIFQWEISNGVCAPSTSTVEIYRDNSPSLSNAGPNQTVCATAAVLAGNVPAIGSGVWTLVSGAATIVSPTSPNSALTGLGVGVNVLQWTVTYATCPPSASTVIVQRDDVPTTSNAGPTQSICATSNTVMAGNSPAVGTGSWTLISGSGTIVTPTLATTNITALGTGTNIFQWTISNGVCASSSSTVALINFGTPTSANAGPNQTVCATATVMAGNVPAVGTGSWTLISGSGTIANPTLATTNITALGVGVNVFMWTISNGSCPSSTSTMSIQHDAVPTTALAGANQVTCSPLATMNGNVPAIGTGSWTLVSGSAIISNPTQANTGITTLGIGVNVFRWTISNGVCASSSSTMSIQRDQDPTISSAGANQSVCATSGALAANNPAVGVGSWNVTFGPATVVTPLSPNSSVIGLGLGSNVFEWQITNGVCPASTSTVEIWQDQTPTIANAGPSQSLCGSSSTVMAGNVPAVGTGIWTLVSGSGIITTPNAPNTNITAIGIGVNVFRWTISNGSCPPSTSTMSITRYLPPTVSVAGPNQTVCATTANMAGNTAIFGTGLWTLVSGAATITTPTLETTSITGLGVGVNVFQWTISNGSCPPSSSTMSIQRDANPTPSIAGPNQVICATATVMAANTPAVGTGTWTLISGSGVIVSANSPNTAINTLGVGVNVFQWTIGNGICPNSSSTVSVQRDLPPTTAVAGPNQTVCATVATMAGNTPGVGTALWTLVSGAGTITTPSSPTSGLTALGVGVNVFQWTISNGVCPNSSATVSVQRDQNPTIASAGTNQTICATATVLAGNVPAVGTGSWTLVSGGATITSPTLPNSGLTAIAVGVNIFQWTISNGICPNSSATVSVKRDPVPTPASAGTNSILCAATTATLNGNTAAVGTGSWTLISGAGIITSPTLPNSGITALGTGTNIFMWTISSGVCGSSTSTVSIVNYAAPTTANAGPSQTVCAGTATLAANTAVIGVGVWNVLSGTGILVTPTSPNSQVILPSVGVTVFEWSITNGTCPISTSTMLVQRDAPPTVANAGPNQTVCATVATMAGNNPATGTGNWTLISGSGTIGTPSSPTSGLTALGIGVNVFQWTISNGVCPNSTSTVSVQHDALPTAANAGSSQSVCATSATLAGNTPAIGTGNWTLISGSGTIVTPTSPNSGLTALGTSTSIPNIFMWTITNGVCPPSTSTVLIDADAAPTPANAGPNQTICIGNATMAGNTPAIGTGSWTLISGFAVITTPTLETSGLTSVAVGTNILQWTITNGVCPPSSSTVAIIRDPLPTTAVAGSSQSVCAISATLAGNTPAIGTGSWTLVQGAGTISTPTAPNSAVTSLGTSTSVLNVFMWTITNGVCPSSSSTVGIDADAAPTNANAGPSQTICAPTTTLAGNIPSIGTGSWTLISGGATITTPTLETTGLTSLAVGTNVLQWAITNGVCPPSTSTVAIFVQQYPTPSNAGVTQTICSALTSLAGNVPSVGTGTWSLVSGVASITSPNLATSGLTGVAVGTNVLQWTIGNGVCPSLSSTVAIVRDPAPTVASAGPNQTICIPAVATLAANVPAIGTGSWTLVSGGATITNPTLPNTGITAVAIGTNILQWTISNGVCPPSISTVAIIRDADPTTALAGPNQTICSGVTTLAGNTPAIGTGSWTLISGVTSITTPTLETSGVTAVAVGTNILQWTISNGVCASSSATMSIVRDPNPTLANAGPTQTICLPASATMAGNIPAIGTGSWTLISGGATITNPTLPNTGITAVAIGTNILQWTISNGVCPPSISTVAVIRDPSPTTALAGPNQTICSGVTTLAGNTPAIGTGSWTLISGLTTITTPTLETSGVTAVAVGTNILQWTISNGVCVSSSATMSIVRDPNPTVANAGPNQTICLPASAIMAGNIPAIGTGSWTLISGGATITSPTLPNTGITAVAIGTNILQWTISNGVCPPSISTVAVMRDPSPTVANAGPSQTICSGVTTLAGNTPAIGTGSWALISGITTITTPTLETTGVTAVAVGTNILQWTISNGVCASSSATMSIVRDPNPTVANAGPIQTICATATVLAGNTPAIGTGSWTLISGGATITTPTLETSGITSVAIGTNVLQWTISNGVCPPSISTVAIIRDPNPTVANAGPNQTICATNTLLAGNTPVIGTGLWTLVSGVATITTPTLNTSALSAIAVGTNILQWTVSNGVCPPSSSTMSVQRDANPTVSNAGPNQTICATSTVLAANTPVIGTGLWTLVSGGAVVATPTLETSAVNTISGGVNVLQWTISNGVCPSSSSTMSIQRDIIPTASIAGPNQTICATATVLAGNTPAIGTGSWTLVSGGALISAPTTPNSGLTAIAGGVNVFQWTISNGVCPPSSSTMSVQRDLPSSISVAGPNQTVCATTAIMAANIPAIGTGTWSLLFGGAAITTPTLPNTGVTTLSVGVNVFRWRIKNGVCPSSTSTMSVQRDSIPTISNAGASMSICASSTVMAANIPSIGTGTWSLVSGSGTVANLNLAATSVTAIGLGTNVFQWTIGNGVCPSSTSTVAVTAYTNPTTASAGPNQTICATATVLAGNTPVIGSGVWALTAGSGVITTPNAPSSGVTTLGVGVNVFQWSISNGVCPVSTSTVSVQRDDNPTPANAGPNQTLCVNNTNLNATPLTVGTGSWTLISGTGTIVNPTSASSTFTDLGIGSNILQWTTSNGICPSTSSTVDITGIVNITAGAGPDIFYCGLSPTLTGVTPTVGTGTWVPQGGPTVVSPFTPTTGVTFTAMGTYTYVWFVGYASCPNVSDTVKVTLYDLPSVSSVSADQTLCISSSNGTISANSPTMGSGFWNVVGGGGSVNLPTSNISPVTALTVGMNSFEWIITNGVCPPSSSTITIMVDDVPSTPVAGPDQTICVNAATLNATNPAIGTGIWNLLAGGSTITTPTLNSSPVTSLNVGVNTFAWYVSNGVCPTVSDTMIVFVDALPTTALAGVDQFTCSMNAFMAANIPAIGIGTWIPTGGAPAVSTPTAFNSAVSFTNQGMYTYIWEVGNGTCPTSTDVVTVNTFFNPSDPDAGPDQAICAMSTTLSANTISVGTGSWIPVNTLSSVTNSLVNITNAGLPGQGTFGFVWQTSNSSYCPLKNDTVYIRTYANPSAANAGLDFGNECLLNSLTAAAPGIGTGKWSLLSGSGTFSDPNDPNTNYTSDVDGTTKLVWTVSNGVCPTTSDTVDLVINPLLLPQIITPNSDGNNDMFEIKAFSCLSGVKINIFNRWGNLVYESGDYRNDWKGENKHGEELADDTYFYVIELPKKTYKGYVVVKKDK
jgi:gliding motility-associated-like protein